MSRKGEKAIPPGVKEAIIKEAASHKKGAIGTANLISNSFGISLRQAKRVLTHDREEIDDMRGKISQVGLLLAGQTLNRISEKLSDDEAMAETSLKDLAMTHEKLVNAAVTAADGHQPKVQINFGEAVERKLAQKERDRRFQDMKKAKSA
jgi:hypothetical protein